MLLEPATREEYLLLADRPRLPYGSYEMDDLGAAQHTNWLGSPNGDIWSTTDYETYWQYYMVGEEIRKVSGALMVDHGSLVAIAVVSWAKEVKRARYIYPDPFE